MAEIINGKKIAQRVLAGLKKQTIRLKKNQKPSLAVILIGHDPASRLYVSLKEKRAKEVGIAFKKFFLPATASQAVIIKLIKKLNANPEITAILVQLPLPGRQNVEKIISAISPAKDADGIHPNNLKILKAHAQPPILPATTGAVIAILTALKIKPHDKSVAIIGKSKIAGLPTYYYLKNKCRAISIYDRSTKNLAGKTKKADLVIVAIGQPKFVTAKYLKPGAVVIDIGISKVKKKTVGDVDFDQAQNICSAITPVPGGVGPVTVAILLQNTLKLYRDQL